MWEIGVYIGLSGAAFGLTIAIVVVFFAIQYWNRKKQQHMSKPVDLELQQLSLSVRTTSEKKVSFEGSQSQLDPLDGHVIATTPRKVALETYSIKDLLKATDDFSSTNLIEGSVFHGRLNGKNLAIKCMKADAASKVNIGLFQDAVHFHPNIIRLVGTCMSAEGSSPDSFLVFEYAKNGSLKDWLHGGLAMKNHFIASCYCFLTWSQRLKICLDVATALQYMHQIMNPCYVHRNIKSRNIFLDEEFNAKIGNFGMAECNENDSGPDHDQDKDQEESCSSYPATWSKGYLAPELLQENVIDPCIDVFAFGVVLLEVLSGQPAISRGSEKGEGNVWLSEKIKSILQSDNSEKLWGWMDSVLGENYSFDAAVTLANLARACVEDDPSLRPNAREIVEKLSRLVEELPAGGEFADCESSCKPLVVKPDANNL